jgi:hypothetical protein
MNDYLKDRMLRKNGLLPKMEFKKPKIPIKKISYKRLAEIKLNVANVNKMDLEKWFADIEEKYWGGGKKMYCMECSEYIPKEYARHATAHLLPKKIFKSIETHPLNYLILGAGCSCHEKSHRVDKFIKLKIWPEAKRRINELIPLLPVDELRRISNQLLIALEN